MAGGTIEGMGSGEGLTADAGTLGRKHLHHSEREADMLRKVFAVIVVLTLLFALGDGAVGSAKAASAEQSACQAKGCTAEQGQLFIAEGRYKDAIREFTCVIEAQPTEVEGYRGRIEAELLLGQYSNA